MVVALWIINFCDNYKKSPVAENRLHELLSLVFAGENKTTTMHISFSICFTIFAFALHMYVVALPLPVERVPDWTHMLNVRPRQIAAYHTRGEIRAKIAIRRGRKWLYEREAVRARNRKEHCFVAADLHGVNTTAGQEARVLAHMHAGYETTWRRRAELEERGEMHFTRALRIHMRRH